MTSTAPEVKAALVETCTALFAAEAVHVAYGVPGTYQPDDIVAVMGSRTVVDRSVMSTARRRRETVETVVLFSAYRQGDQTQQQVATERAFYLLDLLQEYLRVKPNETLGGVCREARVTEHELDESVATNPKSNVVTGRRAVVAAVVTTVTDV